jgi:hypothetical protein
VITVTKPQREPGEEFVTIDATGMDNPLFPARVPDVWWNGWACPAFRRPVAEAVVEWINRTADADSEDATRAAWDGDTVVLTDAGRADDADQAPERIRPDVQGRYGIGAGAWCWSLATQDDHTPDLPTRETPGS